MLRLAGIGFKGKSSGRSGKRSPAKDGGFEREDRGQVSVFRNAREGLGYTFVGGRLRTTYYTAAAAQLARSQTK